MTGSCAKVAPTWLWMGGMGSEVDSGSSSGSAY